MKIDEKRKNLVESLKKQGRIKTKEIEKAFLEIPREEFIPPIFKQYAYSDTPLEIGQGQTISAPHMIAIMCEELDLKKDQKILEIGTGSGYHAAIVAKIIEPNGQVYTIERHKNLAEKAKQNLKNTNIKNVTVEIGDGSEGLAKYAPYDRIYVTCAAPSIPQPLIEQLKDPGKMLIPVGGTICTLYLLEKNNGKIKKENHGGCAFVPLIGKYGH
ncbi:MAG: protein-L-isoaspartate O-methyltransferase [Candidatus Thermoplasmatota archaeon]|nr:protein-L-isoaspartate O-methyltransferase [Candidatus Thermoplasmatota archaeon]